MEKEIQHQLRIMLEENNNGNCNKYEVLEFVKCKYL